MTLRRSGVQRVLPFAMAPLFVLALTAASPAYPSVIPLPVDWAPEGIAAVNHTFYSGSGASGSIFRGDLSTGEGSVFIHRTGRSALGLKVDTRHGLLFVAGGFTGHAYVYDVRTGADVADYSLAPAGALINDVAVTDSAAYFTETFAPHIYKVPIGADGSLGPAQTITVTGPAGAVGGFGLNGIDATPDGGTLVVCLSTLGMIATVDPVTGASNQIAVTSGSLVPGTPDGILLAGHDLWVVENFANTVVRVHLSPDLSTGTVTDTVTNPAFEVPTTVARHGTRLVVVNGKFDLGFPPPLGPGAPPGTAFEAVQFSP